MSNENTFLPETITFEYCQTIINKLRNSTETNCGLTKEQIIEIISFCSNNCLRYQDNLLKINPKQQNDDNYFIVIGDLHGQYHSLLSIFDQFGYPTENHVYVLLGDYVDRGMYGIEILTTLCLLKLHNPESIYFLRGNHESLAMNDEYGFTVELKQKFGDKQNSLFNQQLENIKDGKCEQNVDDEDIIDIKKCCGYLFQSLPLACVIAKTAFCAHAGIFSRNQLTQPGYLNEINEINRFIDEENHPTSIFNQLLWSDPELSDGFVLNEFRGVGILWGSKQSSLFLQQNDLKFIIRSHESPQARFERVHYRLGGMQDGYVQDHCTYEGGAYTVYSAPCDEVLLQGCLQPCRGAVGFLLYPYDEICFQQFA